MKFRFSSMALLTLANVLDGVRSAVADAPWQLGSDDENEHAGHEDGNAADEDDAVRHSWKW